MPPEPLQENPDHPRYVEELSDLTGDSSYFAMLFAKIGFEGFRVCDEDLTPLFATNEDFSGYDFELGDPDSDRTSYLHNSNPEDVPPRIEEESEIRGGFSDEIYEIDFLGRKYYLDFKQRAFFCKVERESPDFYKVKRESPDGHSSEEKIEASEEKIEVLERVLSRKFYKELSQYFYNKFEEKNGLDIALDISAKRHEPLKVADEQMTKFDDKIARFINYHKIMRIVEIVEKKPEAQSFEEETFEQIPMHAEGRIFFDAMSKLLLHATKDEDNEKIDAQKFAAIWTGRDFQDPQEPRYFLLNEEKEAILRFLTQDCPDVSQETHAHGLFFYFPRASLEKFQPGFERQMLRVLVSLHNVFDKKNIDKFLRAASKKGDPEPVVADAKTLTLAANQELGVEA